MKDQDRLLHEIDIEQELEYERLLDERDVNEDDDEDDEDEEQDEVEKEVEEEEVYRAALEALQVHQKELDPLYSAAGMFWLGMSMGWRAFRVLHSRKSRSAIKVIGITRHSLVF